MTEKNEQKLPKIEQTGTNLADVYAEEKDARTYNSKKPDHLHASWVAKEYSNAGANWQWECECRFWESTNLILGKYENKNSNAQIIPIHRDKKLYLYPYDEEEYVYIACDLGGGRGRHPSGIIGLSESGIVCVALDHKRTTPDIFAQVIKEVSEYTNHYIVGIEDDGGAGAECIRATRKIIPDERMWQEMTVNKQKNIRSKKFGWTPTTASIEAAMDKLAEDYPSLTLNYRPLIEQCQTATWDNIREDDPSLDHHWDLLRCLAIANHMRRIRKLLGTGMEKRKSR